MTDKRFELNKLFFITVITLIITLTILAVSSLAGRKPVLSRAKGAGSIITGPTLCVGA